MNGFESCAEDGFVPDVSDDQLPRRSAGGFLDIKGPKNSELS